MSQAHSSFFDCLIPLWTGDCSLIGVTLRPDIARQINEQMVRNGKLQTELEPKAKIITHVCHEQTEPWLFFTDSADFKCHVARGGIPEAPRR